MWDRTLLSWVAGPGTLLIARPDPNRGRVSLTRAGAAGRLPTLVTREYCTVPSFWDLCILKSARVNGADDHSLFALRSKRNPDCSCSPFSLQAKSSTASIAVVRNPDQLQLRAFGRSLSRPRERAETALRPGGQIVSRARARNLALGSCLKLTMDSFSSRCYRQ